MKQTHLDILWFCAFRYTLGRASYIVSEFEGAFVANFDEIPDKTKKLMLRELRWAFKEDSRQREEDPNRYQYELGHACDRTSWQNVLNKLIEWESNEQSK